MYEAVRTRAPNSSKVAGVSTAVLLTALAGYAFSSGLAMEIVAVIPIHTVVTKIDPPKEPPPPENIFQTNPDDLFVPPTLFPPPVFEPDAPPPAEGTGVVMGTGAGSGAGSGGTGVKPPPAPVRASPKMRPGDPPPYPAADYRAKNQGITGLSVCVNAKGRATSASVSSSSGFPGLDAAAVRWVKEARFFPGTLDGKPADMCGHSVIYEWKLETLCVDENARRKEDKLKPCPSKAG